MLGMSKLEPQYHKTVRNLFKSRYCVGLVAGKSGLAFYFFGYQRKRLLFLDPHFAQKVSADKFTYRCETPRLLPIKEIDSSMVVGFLVSTADELEDFSVSIDRSVLSTISKPTLEPGSWLVEPEDSEEYEIIQ
jgi:hypothetical protein